MSILRTIQKQLLNTWMLGIAIPIVFVSLVPESRAEDSARNVLVEVYYREGDLGAKEAIAAAEKIKSDRSGITLVLRDMEKDAGNQERLEAILRHFKVAPKTSPVIYGCNRVIHDASKENSWDSQLITMLRIEVFVRTGCSRCASAKQWLPTIVKEYPGLEFVYRDIAVDSASASRLSRLVEQHRTAAASVPVFYLCDTLVVGFQDVDSTGERLRSLLKSWTHVPRRARSDEKNESSDKASTGQKSSSMLWSVPQVYSLAVATVNTRERTLPLSASMLTLTWVAVHSPADEPPDLPLPGDDMSDESEAELPLPGTGEDDAGGNASIDEPNDRINLPLFGRLSASKLGMPLFTLAVGLVDGFNPCAMWVLLFLLSILVNLKSRKRILAIAGTFVVVSGLAYFAFMAAWLNVFMLIGYLRSIQVGLAVMAIVIGAIHIKDFFAFKRGLSLSIPESAKPGIYARVRSIVTAEHMTGAVLGAITLAVLVNIIELLCTAGLPALYTNVLMQQGYSSGMKYAYLSLYIVAYMFDDTLMVGIVTLTLSRKRMQETQGRWLKLISGSAILLLGVIMLFHPEWLH